MKISYRWLREFVETDLPPQALADRLTMAGIEVAGIAPVVTGLEGVVVGELTGVTPHPAGAPLTLCQVSTGRERFSIVCGAPNVRPGVRAAFAPPGARLPGGRRIEMAVIKGSASQGMLCSEAELGIGEDAGSILQLSEDAEPGADLVAYLGLEDSILEVEITPNRPDCLSVVGVAREVAALTGSPFRSPLIAVKEGDQEAMALATVSVEAPDLCPRYAARLITGLTVGPSPSWLAQRLRSVGLRPVNNLVDVTNYVLWELGHPLHAFDHETLTGGRIVVRRARPGEVLVTLDGQSRALTEAMLVIADAQRAVGLAGVMGGTNTEVTAATRTVLLESAYFLPASIRRTAKALGLPTEASYRFERGADIEGLRDALDRAAQLLADLGGGVVARGVLDVYPHPRSPARVSLRLDRIQRVAGVSPPRPAVIQILKGLGLPVEERGERLEVVVPSVRRDLAIEDDLVEEVIRVWGYDRIPSTLPAGPLLLTRRPRHLALEAAVRQALAGRGLSEAITYSLINPAYLPPFGVEASDPRVVALRNPLSGDRSVLRPTLLPGLLEVLAGNVRRQLADVQLFEIGRVFEAQGPGELAREETRLGVVLTGLRAPRSWHAGKDRVDLFDLKGVVETVVEVLGRGEVGVEEADLPYLEEGRGVFAVVEGTRVGAFGEITPRLAEAFDLSAPVYVGELALDRLEALPPRPTRHRPLPRFPGVSRDLAVVLPAGVPAAEVSRVIRETKSPWIRQVQLFDVYTGEQVGPGLRSLAYSILYQAEDRTLTDAEVNAVHAEVVGRLRGLLGAEVRGFPGEEG